MSSKLSFLRSTYFILLKASLLYVVFLISCTESYAQSSISGTVYEKFDTIPLSFVNIYIKNRPIGTITNDAGQYIFHFPDSLKNDSLYISCIGYKTLRRKLSEISTDKPFTIYLDTCSYNIKQVFVMPEGESAYTIVKKAIKNIPKNYPRKAYFLEAFYREICMRDTKYTRLIEASLNIQDYGYDTPVSAEKVQINEIRKSKDYLKYNLNSKILEKIFGERNLLIGTLRQDRIRTIHSGHYENCLSPDNIHRFIFTLDNCQNIDGKLVYVINFRDTIYDDSYPILKQESTGFCGSLYIMAEDHAIIRIITGLQGASNWNNKYLINGWLQKAMVNYKKSNGKYYLDNIQYTSFIPAAGWTFSNDTVQGKQYYTSIIMVTNIFDSRKEFSRIRDKNTESYQVDLYKKSYPYHPEFWKNYNMVLLDPLIKSVKSDLEYEIPLEEQFKLEGK